MREFAMHIGRSWGGPGEIEKNCPCPKIACGLVSAGDTSPDCLDHPVERVRSMRSAHPEDACPGKRE